MSVEDGTYTHKLPIDTDSVVRAGQALNGRKICCQRQGETSAI